jgi:hypothetical protein
VSGSVLIDAGVVAETPRRDARNTLWGPDTDSELHAATPATPRRAAIAESCAVRENVTVLVDNDDAVALPSAP